MTMYKLEAATKDEIIEWLGDLFASRFAGHPRLNVEISPWKPKKTNSQLGLLFRAAEYFIKARDGFVTNHVDEGEKRFLVQGLVEKYGNKKPSGLMAKNEYGEEYEQLVEIPLSQINRLEDFDVILNGLFFVEAPSQSVDMGGFVKEWQEYQKMERNKKDEKHTDH